MPQVAEILVQWILACRDKSIYQLHEFVVMPNHFHLLLTPGGSASLEKAVQFIKGGVLTRFISKPGIKRKSGKSDSMIGQFETAKTTGRKSGIFK
jgi:putative transposase